MKNKSNVEIIYVTFGKDKKQKVDNEPEICVLCSDELCNTKLKCGHELCVECCIKHFRKNEKCPFCRVDICPHENRKEEIRDLLHKEMECIYDFEFGNYVKSMNTYDYLKMKGVARWDLDKIYDLFVDIFDDVYKQLQNYSETNDEEEEDNEEEDDE